ncbi:MAG: DUF255 domain-containing protein [Rhodobacteraceae bacterium]|nr:DUF255 domain-containing protein [Paracoccaceae bacterium]
MPVVTILPEMPVEGCRGERAKLYDECGSQVALFEAALQKAKAEGKTLLVSYGAEWCIWCHVFDAYIHGEHTRFEHTFAEPADSERYLTPMYERAPDGPYQAALKLTTFFAENFVLVHIDSRYAIDGSLVLQQSDAAFDGGLPFIFSVDAEGAFMAAMVHDNVENRRDTSDPYRGYHREKLEAELRSMLSGSGA